MRTTRTPLRNPASVLFAALGLLAGCQAVPAPVNGTAAVVPAADTAADEDNATETKP